MLNIIKTHAVRAGFYYIVDVVATYLLPFLFLNLIM